MRTECAIRPAQRLKVLAVSTEKRHPDYPAVPTMSESGFPGFEEYTQGLGVVGPAGLPRPIVDQLAAQINKLLLRDVDAEGPNALACRRTGRL